MLIIAWFFPGIMRVDGPVAALAAAFILGIANATLRPVLILLTLPVTILSMGLFLLIINGLMLGLAAWIVPGFYVHGIGGALVGCVLISVVNWILLATAGRGERRP
jgi:putative membrane protein